MVWNETAYTSSLGCGTQNEKAWGELRHHGKEGFACVGDNKHVFTVNKWAAIRHTRLRWKGSQFAPNKLQKQFKSSSPQWKYYPWTPGRVGVRLGYLPCEWAALLTLPRGSLGRPAHTLETFGNLTHFNLAIAKPYSFPLRVGFFPSGGWQPFSLEMVPLCPSLPHPVPAYVTASQMNVWDGGQADGGGFCRNRSTDRNDPKAIIY